MRRWTASVLAAGVVVSAGCSLDDLDGRSDVAAEVAGHELSSDRVAEILAKAGGGANVQAAEYISNIWLDYAMFAEAIAKGRIKADSASIARVMWPEISQARVRIWHDSVMVAMGGASDAAVDSTYGDGTVKVFQHIIAVPNGGSAADSAQAKQAIQQALGRVQRGENFGAVAAEVSADGSKTDEGYLPVGPKGQFVPEFENAAWALAPGQTSGVVESQFGWHIIRRPTLVEARARISKFLAEQSAQRNDSLYMESLDRDYGIEVSGGAAALMRNAASNPQDFVGSGKTLVSMKGDDLSVGEYVRWIGMFPPNVLAQIRNANDTILSQYAKGLAQTTAMLRKADSAGVHLAPAQWQFVTYKYNNSVSTLRRDLGLDVPELSDSSSLTGDQRSKLAAEKIEEYFGRLLNGQAQVQTVLPTLAADLRSEKLGRVYTAGVSRAVELAMAQRRRDSAAAAANAPPPQGIVPAPGGPPIGDSSGSQ
ncbi:MAG: peptidylprolyl isomerase [Gemmatimonadales bacterium]